MMIYASKYAIRTYFFLIFSYISFYFLNTYDVLGWYISPAIQIGLLKSSSICVFATALAVVVMYAPYIENQFRKEDEAWFLILGICTAWAATSTNNLWAMSQYAEGLDPVLTPIAPFTGRILWNMGFLLGGTMHIAAGFRKKFTWHQTFYFWLAAMFLTTVVVTTWHVLGDSSPVAPLIK